MYKNKDIETILIMGWDMANYIIIALLLYIILKDVLTFPRHEIEKPKVDLVKEQEIKERTEEFNRMMNYSLEDAIRSKRGGN